MDTSGIITERKPLKQRKSKWGERRTEYQRERERERIRMGEIHRLWKRDGRESALVCYECHRRRGGGGRKAAGCVCWCNMSPDLEFSCLLRKRILFPFFQLTWFSQLSLTNFHVTDRLDAPRIELHSKVSILNVVELQADEKSHRAGDQKSQPVQRKGFTFCCKQLFCVLPSSSFLPLIHSLPLFRIVFNAFASHKLPWCSLTNSFPSLPFSSLLLTFALVWWFPFPHTFSLPPCLHVVSLSLPLSFALLRLMRSFLNCIKN